MKRLLVIIGNFSSNPSSVANCTKPLLDVLVKRGVKVDLITNRRYISEKYEDDIDNIKIYRVNDSRALLLNSLNELVSIDSGLIRLLTKYLTYVVKLTYKIRSKFVNKDLRYGGWDIDLTASKCKELVETYDYDGVLSISQPFTSHFIAEELLENSKKSLKWFVMQFDPFSFNVELIKNRRERGVVKGLEYRIFSKSDVLLLTPELYKYYQKNLFSEFKEKMVSISYANLQELSFDKQKAKEISFYPGKVNCFFAGRLYKDIRNPDVVLNIFSKIGNDIALTLMTNFDGKQDSYSTNIRFLPFQNRDTALKMMLDANILINIGNSVEMQVPGKLFEYLSTGKPIIHFSKIQNDPALIYLEDYPNVFIVKEWEEFLDSDIERLRTFCFENKTKQYSYRELTNLMSKYVGESVSNDFVDTILRYLKEDTNLNE